MDFRVAGTQIPVGDDVQVNIQRLIAAVRMAANAEAEILLTPEGSLSGYRYNFDNQAVREGLEKVCEVAREYHVGLALGTCFYENDGICYNQIRFYRPDGEYLGCHAKILRCGTMAQPPEGEINHYATKDLQIFRWHSNLTIGGLICNDLWANPTCTPMPDPHLSQQLSNMGVKVIFHAVNGGRDGGEWSQIAWQFHNANLRMRAQIGHIWIVTVDSSEPVHLQCSAPSGVISPDGNWVCQTRPCGEDFFVYTIFNI